MHRRLQAAAQKQQRQQRLSPAAKRPSPRSKAQRKASPSQLQQSVMQGPSPSSQGHVQLPMLSQAAQQQQQQHEKDGSGGGGACVSSSSVVPGSSFLPAGVQFVTVAWISACLRAKERSAASWVDVSVTHTLGGSDEGSVASMPVGPESITYTAWVQGGCCVLTQRSCEH